MKHYLVACLIFLLGCGPTAIVAKLPDGRPILIRSPQPDADDLHELKEHYQLKTVLNLRGERLEDWYLEESLACSDLQIRLINLKASGRRPPSEEEVKQFLGIVNDPNNYPILIHCQGGIHRTGVYVALYRLVVQHWSSRRTLSELERNYFDWTLQDREAIKKWIRSFRF